MTPITELKSNQIFIFGSNREGFHGAGSAGFACRGVSANTWRTDNWFLEALKSPIDSPKRIGKWAILGIGRGWQKGKDGMSYAIQTIERPGQKRSIPLEDIKDQILELFRFAQNHDKWEFLFTPIGAGLSGYTEKEMDNVLKEAIFEFGLIPKNIIIPKDLYNIVNFEQT